MSTKPKRKPPSPTPKLSVFTDREMMMRLRVERDRAETTMEELVNARLRLSYELHPGPPGVLAPAGVN